MVTARGNGQLAKRSVKRTHAEPVIKMYLCHSVLGSTNTLACALKRMENKALITCNSIVFRAIPPPSMSSASFKIPKYGKVSNTELPLGAAFKEGADLLEPSNYGVGNGWRERVVICPLFQVYVVVLLLLCGKTRRFYVRCEHSRNTLNSNKVSRECVMDFRVKSTLCWLLRIHSVARR